jgi:hypothetical protein
MRLFVVFKAFQNGRPENFSDDTGKKTSYKLTVKLIKNIFTVRDGVYDAIIKIKPTTVAGGLRHEPSSLARTLGSWVRISLEAWTPVCV